MATVVNNPNSTDNSGTNIVLGVVLLVIALAMLWFFGFPYFTNQGQTLAPTEEQTNNTDINVQEQPSPAQDTTQTEQTDNDPMFTIPEEVDVNVDGEFTQNGEGETEAETETE